MPIFVYKAVDTRKRMKTGEIIAARQKDVMNTLLERDLTPIEIYLKKGTEKKKFFSINLSSKITKLDKSRICRYLLLFVNSGTSLNRALGIMGRDEKNSRLKNLFGEVKAKLERGESFHQALTGYRKVFSPVFISLIESGETSGNLGPILKRLADDFQNDYRLKKKVIAASTYPLILLVGAVVIVIGLMVFIMPKLLNNFAQFNVDLPIYTRILMDVSNFSRRYFFLILSSLSVLTFFSFLFGRTKKGKIFFGKILKRIPVFGKLYHQLILTRFCQILAMLLGSGLPLVKSLEMTSGVIGSAVYQRDLSDVQRMTVQGIPLSTALQKYPNNFPYLLIGAISIGEETGNLQKMLETIGASYQENVNFSLDSLASTLEPILLIVMGSIIAFIALAILLPIYQTLGSV
jgi:type IV pilus assembly protein PilC